MQIKNFPLNPSTIPFFYGWVILISGTIGIVMSVPGQTVGISTFTDSLITELRISRSLLSLTYLVGTMASSLLLTGVGLLYDRYGARRMAPCAALLLGAVLVGMTTLPLLWGVLARSARYTVYIAGVLSVGFFLIRVLGQGTLTLVCRNMVMEWFNTRRGMVNAVMGTAIAVGFSLSPRFFDAQIQVWGWQGAWKLTAVILALFALFAALFFRNTPESYGLVPDGKASRSKPKKYLFAPAKEFTLREARANFMFWIYTLALAADAFLLTAYTFHIVSIFQEVSLDRSVALGTLFPAAVIAVTLNFIGSWASDYISLKYLLLSMVIGLITASVGMALLVGVGAGAPIGVLIIGLGLMQGQFGTLSAITWPRLYGRTHLGAVSGLSISVVVAGSALGPFVFSVLRDFSGSYLLPAVVCIAITFVLLIGALAVRRERPVRA